MDLQKMRYSLQRISNSVNEILQELDVFKNVKTIEPAKLSTPIASGSSINLDFRQLPGERFDFELKPDQSVLFLPYTGLLYDEKNQVYWIYVVIITPGKPNRYLRCNSYNLHFSMMDFEETNAQYGAIGLLRNGQVLNVWHKLEPPDFITKMAISEDGNNFSMYQTDPARMVAGEDKNIWVDPETGRTYLIERNDRPAREKRRQAIRYSDDGGYSWSDKVVCLEIPESERTNPASVFHYCVVYSMTVCRHKGKYYAAVNIFNEATDMVSIKMAQSDDLYNWTFMNAGNDIIPMGDNKQMYGAITSYRDPGVNDVPERLIIMVQSCKSKHSQAGIFRLSLWENQGGVA